MAVDTYHAATGVPAQRLLELLEPFLLAHALEAAAGPSGRDKSLHLVPLAVGCQEVVGQQFCKFAGIHEPPGGLHVPPQEAVPAAADLVPVPPAVRVVGVEREQSLF